MIDLLLAGLLATASPNPQQAAPPTPAPEVATRLEDIEVVGRPLDSLIRDFVREVGAPNRNRNLARWQNRICVGVANLKAEPAQYIADRVSTVAQDIGLTSGNPGCKPNILVVATDQPNQLAAEMIAHNPRSFRPGGSGMDRGGAALRAFESSTRPVRWWAVSMPVDADTGVLAVRMPGECQNACSSPMDYAPTIGVFSPSRMRTQIVDNMARVVVILDVNQIDGLSAMQIADYVAMVSLAQIDPEADSTRYASILNVFEEPGAADTLTDWDLAYLEGLYSSIRNRSIPGSNRSEVASSIRRAHNRLRAASDTEHDQTSD